MTIGSFTQVVGDVGSSGANGSVLFDVNARQGFFFGNDRVLANAVTVRHGASVGGVIDNDLTVDGLATSQQLGFDPAAMPAMPDPDRSDRRDNGNFASVFCGGHVWNVGSCGGTELTVDQSVCFCTFGVRTVRPCTGTAWGGIFDDTCGPTSQNLTVLCQ